MQPLKELVFGRKHRIGRRLIIQIIAFSSVITLILSVIQLAFEYRTLRSALNIQLDSIAIYVPTIEGSVWDFDEKQIQRALDALVLLPNIDHVRVKSSDTGKVWQSGRGGATDSITRSYPLKHLDQGTSKQIGELEVVANLAGIYRQVVVSATSILVSNALKTFMVALFMLYLIRRLVTSRLETMADKVRELIHRILPLREVVEFQPQPMPEGLDELEIVDWTLDKTTEDLGLAASALQEANEQLERKVQLRTQELEAAISELKAFSYSVSHDLKAPLRAISGFSNILNEDFSAQLNDEGKQLLTRISGAARRMDTLIEDTLSLYKVSVTQFTRQEVDLGAIAREVADQLTSAHPERRVEWDIADKLIAQGDPGLMRTVMENLIGNAWKYSGKREVAKITVGAMDSDYGKIYFVRDNGAGFDMSYANRLFTPFTRLHRDTDFPGHGVGLATVRKVIHRHSGRIWADATENGGATFFFTLPALADGDLHGQA